MKDERYLLMTKFIQIRYFCITDINECDLGICENGANCSNWFGGYTCNCASGFAGINCETGM